MIARVRIMTTTFKKQKRKTLLPVMKTLKMKRVSTEVFSVRNRFGVAPPNPVEKEQEAVAIVANRNVFAVLAVIRAVPNLTPSEEGGGTK